MLSNHSIIMPVLYYCGALSFSILTSPSSCHSVSSFYFRVKSRFKFSSSSLQSKVQSPKSRTIQLSAQSALNSLIVTQSLLPCM